MLKAQLELQQSELELSHFDLQKALFLLESDTGESPPRARWRTAEGVR